MTAGFFSPLPPARTGVADYAAALLTALRRLGPVEPGRDGDINLYHLGNNQAHWHIYRRALDRPGVAVLHDATLQHFFLGNLDRDEYIAEFIYNYGEWNRGLAEQLWRTRANSAAAPAFYGYPMLRRIAERSLAVVVHNPAAAQMVRRHAPRAAVIEIPHLFAPPYGLSAAGTLRRRARLGIPPGRFVFGIFGFLRESKRLMQVLRAFERLPGGSILLVAGDFVSSDLERAAAPLLRAPGIVRAGYAPERDFWQLASVVDACINLRYPAAGETSGITLRLMGIGKPVLLTATAENERFPETACLRIDPGPAECDMLAHYMMFLRDSAFRGHGNRPARSRSRRGVSQPGARGRHVLEYLVYAPQLICRGNRLALFLLLLQAIASAAIHQEFGVRVPMRDGVHLSANVFRPAATGQYPAILVRTPYNKRTEITPLYRSFVERGYAVVVQDVRGRYASEGAFRPLDQEPEDGDDTINWLAHQTWCDGKVGMIGGSYLGIVQWKVAYLDNPHLKAIFPVVSGYDDYRDRFYSTGGAMKLGQRLLWMSENMRSWSFRPPPFRQFIQRLPLRILDVVATGRKAEMYQRALDHPTDDLFWQKISTRSRLGRVRVPVFSVGGWYDNFVESDLAAFSALHRNSNVHRILIGPWPHNMSVKFPNVEFGAESQLPLRALQLAWFDQWLKGKDTDLLSRPPVRIFVMGKNQWRDEHEWPLARARHVAYYLRGNGRANSLKGDGLLASRPAAQSPPDRFTFDPWRPVPTMGGAVCCNYKVFPWGPMDQRPVEQRQDVLVYTSPVLQKDTEVTGPITVVLYVSTSARDTDFTAKLVDVFPNGHARNLTDGILRLRYRNSLERPTLAKPGERYRIAIDAGVTSNVFRKSHRIRLEISSSNFPRFDRNPNTGRPVADEKTLQTARQIVYHDRLRPSHVLLPVIP